MLPGMEGFLFSFLDVEPREKRMWECWEILIREEEPGNQRKVTEEKKKTV